MNKDDPFGEFKKPKALKIRRGKTTTKVTNILEGINNVDGLTMGTLSSRRDINKKPQKKFVLEES